MFRCLLLLVACHMIIFVWTSTCKMNRGKFNEEIVDFCFQYEDVELNVSYREAIHLHAQIQIPEWDIALIPLSPFQLTV